jgi:hypothetical protein
MEIPKDALPRHFNGTRRTSFWQLGDVRSDAPGFVAGEQIGGRATAGLRLVLERAADTDQRSTAGGFP